jgi:hypothetical protein
MIQYGEFLERLKTYCISLGFKTPIGAIPNSSAVFDASYFDDPDWFLDGNNLNPEKDSVMILSARVPYEPCWGVYGGLPRPLIHETADCRTEGTISNFIAPYLARYQFAQNHIYLACHQSDHCHITLPTDLINEEKECAGKNLRILLEKIVELDESGHFTSHSVSESHVSFQLSEQFSHLLRERDFFWKDGITQRIGDFLTADLFVFDDVQQPNDCDNATCSYVETLLPFINSIVTSDNPQLLAAILHLQREFSQAVDLMLHSQEEKDIGNLLCIAGLDIDAAAFRGEGEHYFVPWTAYLHLDGSNDTPFSRLEQDDLFVALMAQEKQYFV